MRAAAGSAGRLFSLVFAAGALVTIVLSNDATAAGIALGLPTFLSGLLAFGLRMTRTRAGPGDVLKHISWGILPLVAGLFVLVEALASTGAPALLARILQEGVRRSANLAAWGGGSLLAVGCNLMNNLPAGLIAGRVVESAPMPERVRTAVLIGVDLGPNLSVTGPLATIPWLTALRREGIALGFWQFLRLGALVMPPALGLAIMGARYAT